MNGISGYFFQARRGEIYPSVMVTGKRFITGLAGSHEAGVMNIFFNKLLQILDEKELIDRNVMKSRRR